MTGSALFVAVFLACMVEAVEALTIVLAAGTGREWRSALLGLGAGLLLLAATVAVLGPAVSAIPLSDLRLFVGGTGTVKVNTTKGSTVTYTGVPSGFYLQVRATRVYATGTTATSIVAEY